MKINLSLIIERASLKSIFLVLLGSILEGVDGRGDHDTALCNELQEGTTLLFKLYL